MPNTPKKPERTSGISHFFAALQYSQAGMRRLWRESAFRQEVAGGALALAVLVGFGASVAQLIGFGILWMVLASVEALNTALEVLVDHLSPEWSVFARDAKDLGSLAVAFLIGANTLYVLWVILS